MNGEEILCPECKFNHNHIELVEINALGQITKIKNDGCHTLKGEPYGRGSRVTITFHCENGHRWIAYYQFHKGQVLRGEEFIEDCSEELEKLTELPRD